MIPVTKPFLPPKKLYEHYLEGIWKRNWLTNNGPLVNELELKLKDHLKLDHLLFVNNGTIALQIALKALGIKHKVITTPFSYVATTSSIIWEGCEPLFVDIDPATFNLDPLRIEQAITTDTTAILATHCFGNACDIERIEEIAKKHDLKVIYDAAHCFGTMYKGRSIFEYGDISTTSFHATKLFHTVEGGAVITRNPEVLARMAFMRNFGHDGFDRFNGVGINGKNSEFHAAMGLCNLTYADEILLERKAQSLRYDDLLQNLEVGHLKISPDCAFNHAYYPIVFSSESSALKAKEELEKFEIFPRRYFYPSLSKLNYVNPVETPISDSISQRILCLPLFHDLSPEEQHMIARILLRCQRY
jgi:dTDP-4-amino-4,6-dideoxygalactose transaminase